MHMLKNLFRSIPFLSLVSAGPLVHPRQEDVVLCDFTGEAAPYVPDSLAGHNVSTVTPRASWLSKRVLTAPEDGQLDSWTADQFSPAQGFEEWVYTEVNDQGQKYLYTSRAWEHDGNVRQVGIKGLCGCTGIVIQSEKGLYLGHIWERVLDAYSRYDYTSWENDVVPSLQDSLRNAGFDKNAQPSLQVRLLVRSTTSPTPPATYGPYYPDNTDALRILISDLIPGLTPDQVIATWYQTSFDQSTDMTNANGKAIATYGTNADGGGENGYALWMGSMLNSEGRIPNSDVTDPIHSGRW